MDLGGSPHPSFTPIIAFSGPAAAPKLESREMALHFDDTARPYMKTTAWANAPSTATTVAFWMRSTSRKAATPFSYAVARQHNELLLYNARSLSLYVNNRAARFRINLCDGHWHHVAVTWRSSDGRAQAYIDGELKKTLSRVSRGHSIRSGGTLIIGQEQDSLGGRFARNQAFTDGDIARLSVWGKVLSKDEIEDLMEDWVKGGETSLNLAYNFFGANGTRVSDMASSSTFGRLAGTPLPEWKPIDFDKDGKPAAESVGVTTKVWFFSGRLSTMPVMSGTPVITRLDPFVNFLSSAALGTRRTQTIGVKATGKVHISSTATGTYTFYLKSRGGSILYIDGIKALDHDGDHRFTAKTASVTLTAGDHDVRIEYFHNAGDTAKLRFMYKAPGRRRYRLVPLKP